MLEELFGNSTICKVLFYLYAYQQGYAKGIADLFKMPVNAVQQQLKRLESGGVIASRLLGRTRLFQFNPRYPFLKELKKLLAKAFDFLPENEIQQYFRQRTRPRRTGKPA